jgi:hypothetical protein
MNLCTSMIVQPQKHQNPQTKGSTFFFVVSCFRGEA